MSVFGSKCDEHYVRPDRTRQTWDRWYSSPAWRKLREYWLSRNPLCAECKRNGEIVKADVVDHINPHKGDWEAFIDNENLQSLCKQCHDRKTAKEDGGFGNQKKK